MQPGCDTLKNNNSNKNAHLSNGLFFSKDVAVLCCNGKRNRSFCYGYISPKTSNAFQSSISVLRCTMGIFITDVIFHVTTYTVL